MQVDMSLHRQPLQLPEERLHKSSYKPGPPPPPAHLTEVQGHLAPQDLVSQQDPQAGDVGAVPGKVHDLRAVTLRQHCYRMLQKGAGKSC